jgi:hypothetical protein
MKTKLSRRKMLQDSATLALGGTFLMNTPFRLFGGNRENKSRVVLVREKTLIMESGKINEQVLSGMLDVAVVKLTQAGSPAEAWKQIIKPSDVVGIKSNHWAELPTPRELENILTSRVLNAGQSRQHRERQGALTDRYSNFPLR